MTDNFREVSLLSTANEKCKDYINKDIIISC